MAGWQHQIKEYLNLSRKEKGGIFVLILLIVLLLLFNIFLPYLISRDPIDFTQFEKEIENFEALNKRYKDSLLSLYAAGELNNKNLTINLRPFEFDPNDMSVEQGRKLGLTERQIKVILNYIRAGGRFKVKQDMARIYSISEQEYHILEPYIKIKQPLNVLQEKVIVAPALKPFPFDPNTLTNEQAQKIGLDESVIKAIINFRSKGGRFNSPADLKAIYTLTGEEYSILEPYIRIARDTTQRLKENVNIMVELNAADSLDLQQLKGIGPSFARRIIKYRELLGGFNSKEQLLEVYGMDSLRYRNIREQVTVDRDKIRKININKVTIKEMTKHPYIEFFVAKSIISFRNEKGEFTDINQIREAKLIYNELYLKIEPYLSVK